MRARLFEDLMDSRRVRPRRRGTLTLPVSILAHGAALAAVVVVPLMAEDSLPPVRDGLICSLAPSIPAPPPPPPRVEGSRAAAARPRPQPKPEGTFTAPPVIPDELIPEPDELDGLGAGDPNGSENGVPGGIGSGPAPSIVGDDFLPTTTEVAPVRAGGKIRRPRKLHDVPPQYPELAIVSRVKGTVILECVISPQGRVASVKLLRGIPLLNDAAISAVEQWVYTPTLLNGIPVPVILTATVTFTLS